MKAIKIAKGKGRALKVAIVRHGELFRVLIQKWTYELGRDRIHWVVAIKTYNGVTLEEAEKVFKAKAAV
jgi:hypothetical protein